MTQDDITNGEVGTITEREFRTEANVEFGFLEPLSQVAPVVLDDVSCNNDLHADEISSLEKFITSPLTSSVPPGARCASIPIILYTR